MKPTSIRLPDFIIGGAPRSATTWLRALLDRHPWIYLAEPVQPEPKFFLVDEEYSRGLKYYAERWFKDAAPGMVTGEKSTNYLESKTAAERMARDLPGLKLIFCLREPAERALSNYLWSCEHGWEDLEFREALESEGRRELSYRPESKYARPYSYFSRGLYARHLRPFLDAFGYQGILVISFDDIVQSPRTVARDIHRFLGVEIRDRDADGLGPINELSCNHNARRGYDETLEWLRRRYAVPNKELDALLERDFGWSGE